MRERRDVLGLTQSQVHERGGPSATTVRNIETGRTQTLSRSKRRYLERALKWRPGSVDDILDGREPGELREPVDIPHITHHPDPAGGEGKYEVTREMGGFAPLKLFGLVLVADQLTDAATDVENGDAGPDRLIALSRKTYHASIELLADALDVDAADAQATVKKMGYLFDDLSGVDDSAAR